MLSLKEISSDWNIDNNRYLILTGLPKYFTFGWNIYKHTLHANLIIPSILWIPPPPSKMGGGKSFRK